jgi:7,8-dihydroneopterin aldolase/epimerase/oxygenase
MIKVSLLDIETYAHHGVFDEEQINGNQFFTCVTVWHSGKSAQQSDKLSDAFDYQIIYDAVEEEMKVASKLLEHLAWRIAKNLSLKDKKIKKIKVSVAKKNPPISGKAAFSKITIKWKR